MCAAWTAGQSDAHDKDDSFRCSALRHPRSDDGLAQITHAHTLPFLSARRWLPTSVAPCDNQQASWKWSCCVGRWPMLGSPPTFCCCSWGELSCCQIEMVYRFRSRCSYSGNYFYSLSLFWRFWRIGVEYVIGTLRVACVFAESTHQKKWWLIFCADKILNSFLFLKEIKVRNDERPTTNWMSFNMTF